MRIAQTLDVHNACTCGKGGSVSVGEYLRPARTTRYFYGRFTQNGLAFTPSLNAP